MRREGTLLPSFATSLAFASSQLIKVKCLTRLVVVVFCFYSRISFPGPGFLKSVISFDLRFSNFTQPNEENADARRTFENRILLFVWP